jgi:DNA-3-methyladenine glycosylase
MPGLKINREFYLDDDVTRIARHLLGKNLMVRSNGSVSGGIIVESEAYSGAVDKASHAFKNKLTGRTKTMFEMGGKAYVYLCYGIHHLFNIVTNREGYADAVLIRAIQPVTGINSILKRRNASTESITLTNGPGKLSKALGIDLTYNGMDMLSNDIWVEDNGYKVTSKQIAVSKRVGVDYAEEDADLPWRFYIKNNDWISKK